MSPSSTVRAAVASRPLSPLPRVLPGLPMFVTRAERVLSSPACLGVSRPGPGAPCRVALCAPASAAPFSGSLLEWGHQDPAISHPSFFPKPRGDAPRACYISKSDLLTGRPEAGKQQVHMDSVVLFKGPVVYPSRSQAAGDTFVT